MRSRRYYLRQVGERWVLTAEMADHPTVKFLSCAQAETWYQERLRRPDTVLMIFEPPDRR